MMIKGLWNHREDKILFQKKFAMSSRHHRGGSSNGQPLHIDMVNIYRTGQMRCWALGLPCECCPLIYNFSFLYFFLHFTDWSSSFVWRQCQVYRLFSLLFSLFFFRSSFFNFWDLYTHVNYYSLSPLDFSFIWFTSRRIVTKVSAKATGFISKFLEFFFLPPFYF